MPVRNKLLVLAIDAASPALLRRWAAAGRLPNIAALMAEGLVADTLNVEALYVGSTWPSFSTGLNPAGHGVYWLDIVPGGSYAMRRCTAGDLARRKTLWETLNDSGRRVMVLDVPLARPIPGLNGIQVVEWGTHDPLFGFRTMPPRLARTLLRDTGPHPAPRVCDAPRRSSGQYREFVDQQVRGAAMRGRWTRDLLRTESWEFAIQVFGESHCAGHQLWHLHDPRHPCFDAAASPEGEDPILAVYRAIDTAIGEIVADQSPETTVVLMTLHGMRCMFGHHALTAEILLRLGVMVRGSLDARGAGAPAPARGGRLRAAYHKLPRWLRGPLYDLRQLALQRGLGHGAPLDLDPAASRCFDVGLGPTLSPIRFNQKGREPEGILEPGPVTEAFAAELTRQFLEIVEPGTGRHLVRRVLRTAEVFQGPYLAELPDLLVEWHSDPPIGTTIAGTGRGAVLRAASAGIGVVEYVNHYGRTGDHEIGGLLIARGPGIQRGELGRVVSTLDLAPTFARRLGVEMPDVDGRLIPELLRSPAGMV